MKRLSAGRIATGLLPLMAAGCSTTAQGPVPGSIQPDGQHAATHAPAARTATEGGSRRYTDADVRFMQRMVAHHAQALAMTSVVHTRSRREDVRLLAQRIEVSQKDEIAQMQRWLRDRRQEIPSADPHQGHHGAGDQHASMPGMLTHQELTRLAEATGSEFDRLFLEFMIRHHEGALVMVAELLATPGAGQETEIFRFASEVDADQGIEIARMRRMQRAPSTGVQPR